MSTTEDRGEKQVYELGYLVLTSIPEDKLPDTVSSIKKIIEKNDGVTLDGETPVRRNLAYKMTKTIGASRYVASDAYIGWTKFELEPSKIEGVKSEVEKIDEILRSLLIKAPRETVFTLAKAEDEGVVGEEGVETPSEAVVPEDTGEVVDPVVE